MLAVAPERLGHRLAMSMQLWRVGQLGTAFFDVEHCSWLPRRVPARVARASAHLFGMHHLAGTFRTLERPFRRLHLLQAVVVSYTQLRLARETAVYAKDQSITRGWRS
jgi:hypothetical protein